MRDVEILVDLAQTFARRVRTEIEGLSAEELAWQPDPRGNSIGVTVWHCARSQDVVAVRLLANEPADAEVWYRDGWARATGYDPRGIGFRGYGILTDYTWAEVLAVPRLPAAELLSYLDRVSEALCAQILALPGDALDRPAAGDDGGETAYFWIKAVLLDGYGHIGEIQALKALRQRTRGAP